VRVKPKRKCPPGGNDESRRSRRAKFHEFGQTSGIKPFDRQRKERFRFCRDEDGTSTVEFGKAATDANVTFAAK
jgi:hypothetical protein